ncbi:MAG TPA: sigma-70 family RNA polymerase sigma factor [Candidatus Acidoferrum sp.]|nr:sigma-70 family RNA polymerase sigma factor [Candidatus Acidoferrum sp.]
MSAEFPKEHGGRQTRESEVLSTGAFILPDGQELQGISPNHMQLLMLFPTSVETALTRDELAKKCFAFQRRSAALPNAKIYVERLFADLRPALGRVGWNIVGSASQFAMDRTGRKYRTDNRYYLTADDEFSSLCVEKMSGKISDIYGDIVSEEPGQPLFDVYTRLAQRMPQKASTAIIERAILAIKSENPEQMKAGKQVFIALNLKSVLTGISPFLTKDNDHNDELVQSVLTKLSKYGEVHIHNLAGLNSANINMYAGQEAERFNNRQSLQDASLHTIGIQQADPELPDPSTLDWNMESVAMIRDALDTLTSRQRYILTRHYLDGQFHSKIAGTLGISIARVGEIDRKTIRRLSKVLIRKRLWNNPR